MKNFAIVHSSHLLDTSTWASSTAFLVSIEAQYRGTAPALLPLQMQDIPIEEEDVSIIEVAQAAMTLLYEALSHTSLRI